MCVSCGSDVFFNCGIFFAEMGLWFGKMAHYVREPETCGSKALPSFFRVFPFLLDHSTFYVQEFVVWKREFLSQGSCSLHGLVLCCLTQYLLEMVESSPRGCQLDATSLTVPLAFEL